MPSQDQSTMPGYDIEKYRTPTGSTRQCKGWIQEAALRMLLNNLDPEVAEKPESLIVYGGRGKAARRQNQRRHGRVNARNSRPSFAA